MASSGVEQSSPPARDWIVLLVTEFLDTRAGGVTLVFDGMEVIMSKVAVGVLVGLTALPLGASSDSATVLVGDALVGVDQLGRVLVAVDSVPTDGLADTCFLYTGRERLAGPWSRQLSHAMVVHKSEGTLSVEAAPPDFVLSVAVVGAEPQVLHYTPGAEVFEDEEGLELAFMNAGPSGGASLDQMSHEDLETWPESFWYDLLDPASGPCPDDSDCTGGGNPSTGCEITCLFGQQCGTTCPQDTYSCCKCLAGGLGGPSCRCRPCIPGP